MSDRLSKPLTGQFRFRDDADRIATLANLRINQTPVVGVVATGSASLDWQASNTFTVFVDDADAAITFTGANDDYDKLVTVVVVADGSSAVTFAFDGDYVTDVVWNNSAQPTQSFSTDVYEFQLIAGVVYARRVYTALAEALVGGSVAVTGAATSATVAATGAITGASAALVGAVTSATLAVSGNAVLGTNVQRGQGTQYFAGRATLSAGTIAVVDTTVAAGDIIVVTPMATLAGRLFVTISAGVGFSINSTTSEAVVVSWIKVKA